ncbi:MAG: ubiquitin-like protein UBact [Nitrospirae bacterium]|nr:ubiquitin-like protein UBact [Nitrospirota bacterium]
MKYITMPERREGPVDPMPKSPGPSEEGGGPKRPETGSPDKDNLLKRMRKVDPKRGRK